jgi:hypothetical protein
MCGAWRRRRLFETLAGRKTGRALVAGPAMATSHQFKVAFYSNLLVVSILEFPDKSVIQHFDQFHRHGRICRDFHTVHDLMIRKRLLHGHGYWTVRRLERRSVVRHRIVRAEVTASDKEEASHRVASRRSGTRFPSSALVALNGPAGEANDCGGCYWYGGSEDGARQSEVVCAKVCVVGCGW